MKKAIARCLLLAVALGVVAIAPLHAADVDGKWTGSIDTPMGAIPIEFSFKADGATLNGSMLGPDGGQIPIKNGKVDGGKISFNVSIDFGGMSLDFAYTGALSGDTLQMSSDFMGMPFMFSMKKAQ
jgi:hypothetical protein